MASWLAYMKSRRILPRDGDEDIMPEADELAAHLAFRLQRLDAMRLAAKGLFRLPQVGQNVHKRGMPEGLRSRTTPLYGAEMFDVLQAYGMSRSRVAIKNHKIPKPLVLSLEGARLRLKRAIMAVSADSADWVALEGLLPASSDFEDDIPVKSIKASSLLAGLELAKAGELEMRQTKTFAPIYVRTAQPSEQVKSGETP